MSKSRKKRIIPLDTAEVAQELGAIQGDTPEVAVETRAEWFDEQVAAEVKQAEAAAPQTWTEPQDMAAVIADRLQGLPVFSTMPKDPPQGPFALLPPSVHRFPERIAEAEAEQRFPVACRIIGSDKPQVKGALNALLRAAREPVLLDRVTIYLHAVRGIKDPVKDSATNLFCLEIQLIFRVRPGQEV